MGQSTSQASSLRSPRTVVAGVLVLLCLVGGVVAVIAAGDDAGRDAQAAPPAGNAAGTACRPGESDQAIPRSAPPVTWTLFNSIAVPKSVTAGPLDVRAEVPRCYAHTPVGALIAQQQISIRAGFGPAWRSIMREQMVPGPGREAFARARAAFVPSSQPGSYAQTAGFRFISYSPASAVIQIASRAPDGGLWATTSTMVWDGMWKLQPTTDGKTASAAQELTSLEGFVAWGGV